MLPAILFAAMCLLEGSLWLIPVPPAGPLGFCVASLTSCVVLVAAALLFRPREPAIASPRMAVKTAALGAASFGLPAFLLELARTLYAGQDGTAIFVAVPLIVALAMDTRTSEEGNVQRVLFPGLVGLTGSMLIVPVGLPVSLFGWIGLLIVLLSAVVVGTFSLSLYRSTTGLRVGQGLLWMSVGNAVFYGVVTVTVCIVHLRLYGQLSTEWGREGPVSFLKSLSVLALGFVSVQQLPPIKFAARFSIAVLVALVEGFLLWRPTIGVRDALGAILMAYSAITLIRDKKQSPTAVVRFTP